MGFARAFVDRLARERDRGVEALEPLGLRAQFAGMLAAVALARWLWRASKAQELSTASIQ